MWGWLPLWAAILSMSAFNAHGAAQPEGKGPVPETRETNALPPLNVILVIVDALRGDRIEAKRNGVSVMPRLRERARQWWYFTNAVAQETWTKPSVASIFTSLYPDTHGVQYFASSGHQADVLPVDLPTLASILHASGYHTKAIQTSPTLQKAFGFDRGFDEYLYCEEATADVVTGDAIASLRTLAQPYFLYIHYFDPHGPYLAPPPRDTTFGNLPPISVEEKKLLDSNEYYMDHAFHATGIRKDRKYGALSETAREYVRYCYDIECRFVDDQFAEFAGALGSNLDNTFLLFTADHGEELWDHGGLGHSKTVFEEVVHVPLLIHFPNQTSGRMVPLPVQSVDILPTIAARIGIEPNPAWQGVDIAKLPLDAPAVPRPQFSWARGTIYGGPINFACVRMGKYKLIADRYADRTEAYNLEVNPHEQQNLANESSAEITPLKALLLEREEEDRAARAKTKPVEKTTLDPKTREALQSLGYLPR